MDTTLTLAAVLTSVAVVAVIVGNLVEYLQWSLPFFANINGRGLAFVISAAFYVAAWFSTTDHGLDSIFVAVLAWIGCGMALMGLHQFQKETKLTLKNKLEG